MTTKNTYELRLIISALALLFFMIIGSFVVSFKIIDLFYIIALIVYSIKFLRLED